MASFEILWVDGDVQSLLKTEINFNTGTWIKTSITLCLRKNH